MRRDAVIDGRLANPEIIARPVRFTLYEQRVYKETSAKIKEISARLQAHDPITISKILMNGGPRSSLRNHGLLMFVSEKKSLTLQIRSLIRL